MNGWDFARQVDERWARSARWATFGFGLAGLVAGILIGHFLW